MRYEAEKQVLLWDCCRSTRQLSLDIEEIKSGRYHLEDMRARSALDSLSIVRFVQNAESTAEYTQIIKRRRMP